MELEYNRHLKLGKKGSLRTRDESYCLMLYMSSAVLRQIPKILREKQIKGTHTFMGNLGVKCLERH